MTATQLALGIFFGFGGLELFKIVLAVAYEKHKRNAMVRDLQEIADDFVDSMRAQVMAAHVSKNAKRRKPTAKAPVTKKKATK